MPFNMKKIILVSIFFIFLIVSSNSPYKEEIDYEKLNFIREKYYVAIENIDTTKFLKSYMENNFGKDFSKYNPILMSYYACLTGLEGKFEKNLVKKVKLVFKAISIIDSSVNKFPDCLEIRFLRFSFFDNLPDYFNVSKKRNDDLNFVYDYLFNKDFSFVPKKIQIDMIKYIVSTRRLNDEQNLKLIRILNE
ncbi:MAG: hypothetical protein XD76_0238 [candidate division TA06 bacterium 32_111]|uniref:Uncharacterized protein n=2 Tax=Bacteria candidate phyla TaxID=1783234 RepID=A0A124G0A5_UNCT6|nr:MAG: hypothetical protein XD76_0238 [candidate division TA06 bacterium 32_111]KUK86861.1 MAG: hypothetical protein XE03_1224 [candidate division TA06 bacterium 34_109]HAF07300.1 hypothetical protein [candidate division WOR-3 bacterium]HCP16466.1 hypothetical protein [candidate division WOR-3 bacterium]